MTKSIWLTRSCYYGIPRENDDASVTKMSWRKVWSFVKVLVEKSRFESISLDFFSLVRHKSTEAFLQTTYIKVSKSLNYILRPLILSSWWVVFSCDGYKLHIVSQYFDFSFFTWNMCFNFIYIIQHRRTIFNLPDFLWYWFDKIKQIQNQHKRDKYKPLLKCWIQIRNLFRKICQSKKPQNLHCHFLIIIRF